MRFEFNYQKQFDKGSFLGVLYFHNNQDDITRYSDTLLPNNISNSIMPQ